MAHKFIRGLLAVAVLAFVGACGSPAPTSPARTVRFPTTGAPAFVVDLPAGWATSTDKWNNFRIVADDGCCTVQLSMINDPATLGEPIEQQAADILKAAGAPPYTMRVYDALGGLPAQTFITKTSNGTSDLSVTIAQVDAGHLAVAARVTPKDQDDAKTKTKDLVTLVRIDQGK